MAQLTLETPENHHSVPKFPSGHGGSRALQGKPVMANRRPTVQTMDSKPKSNDRGNMGVDFCWKSFVFYWWLWPRIFNYIKIFTIHFKETRCCLKRRYLIQIANRVSKVNIGFTSTNYKLFAKQNMVGVSENWYPEFFPEDFKCHKYKKTKTGSHPQWCNLACNQPCLPGFGNGKKPRGLGGMMRSFRVVVVVK